MSRAVAIGLTSLILAACGPADPPSAPEAAAPAPATASPAGDPAGAWTKVRITGLTCGDNCYVQIQPVAGGEGDDVMCSAELCAPWFEAQALAAGVADKTWEVQMGTAEQVDNEGTVMDDAFPAILAIREAS